MSEHEELIEGARGWDEIQVRRYSEKAHRMINALTDALEAATKQRTVSTVEELDALPSGAVLLTDVGGIWEKWRKDDWRETGSGAKHDPRDLAPPAAILFTPTDAGSN